MKKFYTAVTLAKIEYMGNASKTFSSRLWQVVEGCGHKHITLGAACVCSEYSQKKAKQYLDGFVAIKDNHGELWSVTGNKKIDAVHVENKDKDVCDYCLKEKPV
jgi:hypothetical protein